MYRIIVPLDGSELSEQSLILAQSLARALKSPLELVHVLEEPVVLDLMPSLILPDKAGAERYLNRVSSGLPGDLNVTGYTVRGHPADELLRLTSHTDDDRRPLIVMSTHGRGGLGRLVFGSVADKVMRAATVPVVLVRESAHQPRVGLRNLLVPLDGSELAEAMIPLALELARDSGAALHFVRVVEPFWSGQYVGYAPEAVYLSTEQIAELENESRAEARTYLDGIANRLRDDSVRVVWEVRSGKAAEEIVRASQTTDSDLVLMSSHGRGGIRRWAFGSVTNEVLHRGIVPVLVMMPNAQRAAAQQVATTA